MRCIKCGTNSLPRQRKSGRCHKCHAPFAFEPAKDRNRVTDVHFLRAISRASGGGKVMFTERNLWYQLNRKLMKWSMWRSPFGALPFLAAASGLVLGPVGVLIGLAAGLQVGLLLSAAANRISPRRPGAPRVEFDDFKERYLQRWQGAHGPVTGLLPPREVALAGMPREVPGDVAAFSFDRVVVTDTWETAQLLVANRFHFEHNCAVLSLDGYPDGIADTVKEMLRRNSRLTVFALHDATPAGCLLPLTLREPEWFPDPSIRIVDLGLRPRTVRRLRIHALAGAEARLSPRLAELLPRKDRRWLERGHAAELAALRPEQVLRVAYQGIAAAEADARRRGAGGGGGGGGGSSDGGVIIWVGDLSPRGDTASVDGFG